MLQATGNAKYADIVELELYNGILSGISMEGTKFFYTNPLAASANYPYQLRWQGGRQPYIQLSNCCPPNAVRTIAEISNYMYSLADDGLYVNLYGGSNLTTSLKDGAVIKLEQQTNYPWNGKIALIVKESSSKAFNIHLRIPGWCKRSSLTINGRLAKISTDNNGYAVIQKNWKAGDKIELVLDMPAVLLASNPMVEETRNQVVVKRGPVVYCIESADLAGQNIFDVAIPASIKFKTLPAKIGNGNIFVLTGEANLFKHNDWKNSLYKEVDTTRRPVKIKLIPYYAWANRGASDMTVWMPLLR